jgi:hypothetical protein
MSLWRDPTAVIFAQISLAAIFGLAAWGKLRHLEEFVGVVRNYRLLPEAAVRPVAYTMPFLEAAIAVAILIGLTRPYAAIGGFGLLAIFTLAMGVNILRGRRYIDCGCFRTALKQRLSWWLVARNGALMAMAALVVAVPDMTRPIVPLDAYAGAMAAIVVVLFYVASGHVLSEPPKTAS